MSSTVQAAPEAGSALSVAEVVAAVHSALDLESSMQWWRAWDVDVTDAVVALGRVVSRAQALLTRAVGELDARDITLGKGALLCGHHHHVVHHVDWLITLASDGVPEFRPPAWIDPERRPQRNQRHR